MMAQSGIKIKLAAIEVPCEGEVAYKKARENLKIAVSGKKVELKNMADMDFDCLVCDVYIAGKDVGTKL